MLLLLLLLLPCCCLSSHPTSTSTSATALPIPRAAAPLLLVRLLLPIRLLLLLQVVVLVVAVRMPSMHRSGGARVRRMRGPHRRAQQLPADLQWVVAQPLRRLLKPVVGRLLRRRRTIAHGEHVTQQRHLVGLALVGGYQGLLKPAGLALLDLLLERAAPACFGRRGGVGGGGGVDGGRGRRGAAAAAASNRGGGTAGMQTHATQQDERQDVTLTLFVC